MTTLAPDESTIQHAKAGSVTVKIYRGSNRGRTMFTVAWMIGERRFRRNFASEKRAVRFAKTQAKELSAGRVDASCISTTEAAEFREAQRRLREKAPLHVAAGEYASAVETLGGAGSLTQAVQFFLHNSIRPEMTRTVSQVVEEFLVAKRANGLSETYINDATWRLRRFAGDFQTSIAHVCTRDIEQWLAKLTTGLVTRSNFRRHIITLFNFARRRGYLPRDRETEAHWLEKPKLKSKPIEVFTPGELAEILAVAEGQSKLAIIIGAFTGIRSAEILRLRWDNFNWEEQVIDIGCDQTKTASRRLVPILPPLVEWIQPFVQTSGPVLNYSLAVCLAEGFGTVAKKVTKARGEGARPFAWKQNALRHSYASYRLAITNDAAQVALELGNSPQKLFSNYRKVVTRSQAIAWFSVMPTTASNVVPMKFAAG